MTEPNETLIPDRTGEMPTAVLAALILAAFLLLALLCVGLPVFVAGVLPVMMTDGIMALLLLLAAAGYGWTILRPLRLGGHPALLAATSAGVGMWLLSVAVLLVGTFLPRGLTPWVWWPVVIVGGILAMLHLHGPLGRVVIAKTQGGGALIWVLAAAAAGMWMAGACLPPGWLGNLTMDSYDILEYHLQLPREYLTGGVSTLNYNVYSHYPLMMEMLFLLGMCLRGGAYEGMYLAQFIPGLFGIIMIAGVWGGLAPSPLSLDGRGKGEGGAGGGSRDLSATEIGGEQAGKPVPRFDATDDFRARVGVVLLATAPWVAYLSWLAMEEMGEFCFLALAVVWLRRWLKAPAWKSAGVIGAMLGAACCAKYLSVGLIAGPVLAVMAVVALVTLLAAKTRGRGGRLVGQVVLAGGLTLALFSPWLIRNVAATGNPVFPLAGSVFGHGGGDRWDAGHGPEIKPPVPVPPDYKPPVNELSRRERCVAFLAGLKPYNADPPLGAALVLLAVGTVLGMFLRPRGVGGWDWALLAILAMQLLIWALYTHGMPARFASVCVVPLALLSAGGLARLTGVREVKWLKAPPGGSGRWGMAPAVLLAAATSVLGLMAGKAYLDAELARYGGIAPAGIAGIELAQNFPDTKSANALPPGSKVMLVGEARAFYFPPGTVYATVFDADNLPLVRVCDMPGLIDIEPTTANATPTRQGASVCGGYLQICKKDGTHVLVTHVLVTHVLVSWVEIERLRYTYGWRRDLDPADLAGDFSRWPVVEDNWIQRTPKGWVTTAPASQPASGPASAPATTPAGATNPPVRAFTLYKVP
jgi:hypothetical protein